MVAVGPCGLAAGLDVGLVGLGLVGFGLVSALVSPAFLHVLLTVVIGAMFLFQFDVVESEFLWDVEHLTYESVAIDEHVRVVGFVGFSRLRVAIAVASVFLSRERSIERG